MVGRDEGITYVVAAVVPLFGERIFHRRARWGGRQLSRLDIQEPEVLRTRTRKNCTIGAKTKISQDRENILLEKICFAFKNKEIFWNLYKQLI